MIVQGITREALEHIAERRGVKIQSYSVRWIVPRNVRVQAGAKLLNTRIEQHSFVLRPVTGSDKYRAYSLKQGWRTKQPDIFEPEEREVQFLRPRRKAAICWHGHRDFMRDVFAVNPHASIKTCMARYADKFDFERTHERTRTGHTGPYGYGIFSGFGIEYADGCPCEGHWDRLGDEVVR